MVKTIVVPLDGSRRSQAALLPAAWLASHFDADIRLITTTFSADTTPERAFLERSKDLLPPGFASSEVIRRTFPASGIIEEAESAPDAVVCMSTRGCTRFGRLLLGSVADEVMRRTTIPVVLVGPDCQSTGPTADELVLWVDERSESTGVVPVAATWAAGLGASVRVVSVIDGDDITTCNPLFVARFHVKRYLEDAGVTTSMGFAPNESAAEGIVAAATDRHAGLVVMSTHSTSGWRGHALGHITSEVVRTSPCPILAHPVSA